MKIAIIALFIVGLIAFVVMRGFRAKAQEEMPFPELIQFLDKEAVSIAKDSHRVNLDHSDASIVEVEKILAQLHTEYKRRNTEEGMRGLALAFGVYIGEVIGKNHGGGRWEQDHPQVGPDTMPYHWRGGASFPVAWCLKRLKDGDAESVEYKYSVLVLQKDTISR